MLDRALPQRGFADAPKAEHFYAAAGVEHALQTRFEQGPGEAIVAGNRVAVERDEGHQRLLDRYLRD
jgi:hypothetical protein